MKSLKELKKWIQKEIERCEKYIDTNDSYYTEIEAERDAYEAVLYKIEEMEILYEND